MNYGITELEMTGLMVNMENWKFYLGRKDFDAAVDHRAIPYIMKSKELPTTERIIRILQRLGRFNFHLYYVKGKDMILCDFLSRVNVDDSDPHNLIPIAFHQMELEPAQFNPNEILEYFYRLEELGYYIYAENVQPEQQYFIMTRKAAQEAGAKLPEVHGADKPLDPNLVPEKDKTLQKQILAEPAKIKPSGPVAKVSGAAPLTPYLPRAIPQIKLPVKVAPPTPASPPRIPRPTPKIPQTPQQIRPRNLPTVTPVTVPKISTPQTYLPTPNVGNRNTTLPRKILLDSPQTPMLSKVKRENIADIPKFELDSDPLDPVDQKPAQHIPMPAQNIHPSFQAPQKQIRPAQIQDLKGDPWLDPTAEPPLEESSVDAFFRYPMKEDFIIPPTLSKASKNKTLLAKDLPK